MEKYSIFDYTILRDMIINAWKNLDWVREFIKCLISTYNTIFFDIIIIFTIIRLIWFIYKHIKRNWFKVTKLAIKNTFNEQRQKYKKILRKLRYLLIWFILIESSRLFVSLIFYFISKPTNINYETGPEARPRFLWTLAFQALLFFTVAPYFIWFSFGNKFVRNIWIFVYIIWISIIILWLLWHSWFYVPTK